MTRQLLRNSKVVIEYAGSVYQLSALSEFSIGTSLSEVTKKRKTLFSNTVKQHSSTSKINPSTVNLQVHLTDNKLEKIFFDLIGMNTDEHNLSILPNSVNTDTKLFSMYIVNEGSVMYSKYNFVEAIDISMSKASMLKLNISISSAGLVRARHAVEFGEAYKQGSINAPTYIDFKLDTRPINHITGASISLQQSAEWLETKTLFSNINEIYQYSKAATSDIILSATIQTNYLTDSSEFGAVDNQYVELTKSGLGLFIANARVVHNLDIGQLYTNRLDVSISEQTDAAYFYFGEQNGKT